MTERVSHKPTIPLARSGRLLLLGLAFLCLGAAAAAPAAAEGTYLGRLQQRAAAQSLAAQRYWQVLLHYLPTWRGAHSLIDDPAFFFAPDGQKDPAAELEATLAAFFETPGPTPDRHARCRFPARFAWLSAQLEIDSAQLPPVECREWDQALEKIDPHSAELIFPGTHNNSPASMFGHTLINIQGPYRSKLLSYAVNYSAFTDETNGFAYAVKGIFGLYRGYYSVLPYSQKVREYNDLERRDVWEYELNLSREETLRMLRHIWELREIYSDYYFFDENCAYQLLFLLEAARPQLRLTEAARPWVIPIDTVRIIEKHGLVAGSAYRPSKATRIAHINGQMDAVERDLAQQLLDGARSPDALAAAELDNDGRIRILDLVAEKVEFDYLRKQIGQEEYRRRYRDLLSARSRLGLASQAPVISEPVRPDRGHGSNRLGVGAGWWKQHGFAELALRPAYHNLLDADQGYLAGSQIDFTNLVLRYYPRRAKLELHALDLVSIVSLSPRHRFFRPVSWKVETGFFQKTFAGGDDHLAYRLNPGGGFTFGSERAMVYLLGETDLQAGGRFDHGHALGLGGSLGLLWTPGTAWKTHLRGRQLWFELGDAHRYLGVQLEQNYRFAANQGLSLELSRHKEFGFYSSEIKGRWNLFW
ncbi:hypothetical protein DESUT3_05080 [Desulfuromonas versatilis]|uniref:DUF4105 domain-containing protein n=1 Tax=Desulfuromonas versatilis TaxID=2802975 RepID=A0ABM8HSK1_9BACT|nr:DUF4105 domain-containing protein [Desulfuromonas versatilis]BCR03439.1 hypothetical protein DESUT3_05080 [Desulfuromonas versatilis]